VINKLDFVGVFRAVYSKEMGALKQVKVRKTDGKEFYIPVEDILSLARLIQIDAERTRLMHEREEILTANERGR
jgi:hypothetical protein